MTVLDNILLGRNMLMKSGDPQVRDVLGAAARREEIEHRRRAEEIIDFLNITGIRTAPAGSLPLGLRSGWSSAAPRGRSQGSAPRRADGGL